MSRWTDATLGEVATISIGRTPSTKNLDYWTEDLSLPFCTIADMTSPSVDPGRQGVTALAERMGKAKRVPKGALLMSFKLSIGRVGFAARDLFPNEAIAWLRPTTSDLDVRFLAHALEAQDLTEGSGRAVKGATLNGQSLRAIRVTYPSLKEQRRFIAVVAAVDMELGSLRSELRSVRRAHSSILSHYFAADSTAPRVGISDCATLVTGRAFPAKFQGELAGEIPYVKVSDLGAEDGPRRIATAANWVSTDVAKQLTARACPAGTVLFPIIGAAMLTEKRRILARDAAFDQNVMGLIPNDRVVPEYLFAAMSSIRLGDLRQTGAVPSVNQLLVGAIEIPLPPKEEQEKIAASVDSVLDVIERLSSELAALRTVRADLLSALLSQEITVDAAVDRFVKAA